MSNVDWAKLRDQCLVGLAAVAFLWAASQVAGRLVHIIVVVLLAVVLAFALEPLLRLAQRVLPRTLAAVLIYALALAILATFVLIAGPPAVSQAESLATRLPGYLDQVNTVPVFEGTDLAGSLRGFAASALSSALTVAAAVASGVVDAALVLVLGFWFMVDGRRMADVAVGMVPAAQRDKAGFVRDAVSRVLGAYIRGQLTMALIIGISAGVGSWMLGVHYPILIGILAFLFELMPMVGPILASLPAVMISLTQPFPLVVYVIVFFIVMQLLENNVLAPRITGAAVGLHPVAALIAIVIGADLGGVVGALFAIPVAGVASVLIAAIWKGWRGDPIVVERAGMRFRLPRKRQLA